MDIDATDPEEFCMNCGRKISGRYRECEFCGKPWAREVDDERKAIERIRGAEVH